MPISNTCFCLQVLIQTTNVSNALKWTMVMLYPIRLLIIFFLNPTFSIILFFFSLFFFFFFFPTTHSLSNQCPHIRLFIAYQSHNFLITTQQICRKCLISFVFFPSRFCMPKIAFDHSLGAIVTCWGGVCKKTGKTMRAFVYKSCSSCLRLFVYLCTFLLTGHDLTSVSKVSRAHV